MCVILHQDRYSVFASGWVVMQARDREARCRRSLVWTILVLDIGFDYF
jgi:hypothetical protein